MVAFRRNLDLHRDEWYSLKSMSLLQQRITFQVALEIGAYHFVDLNALEPFESIGTEVDAASADIRS